MRLWLSQAHRLYRDVRWSRERIGAESAFYLGTAPGEVFSSQSLGHVPCSQQGTSPPETYRLLLQPKPPWPGRTGAGELPVSICDATRHHQPSALLSGALGCLGLSWGGKGSCRLAAVWELEEAQSTCVALRDAASQKKTWSRARKVYGLLSRELHGPRLGEPQLL